MDTNARDVSLGYYLAVLTRCWLLIELASELLRCVLWFVEDSLSNIPPPFKSKISFEDL